MRKESFDYIKLYPKKWKDFLAGAQAMYPTEVPPMILVREAFLKHLESDLNLKQ